MESPSAPEQHSADPKTYDPSRPPWLEFSMGIALFAMCILLFAFVQGTVQYRFLIERTPELADIPLSFRWHEDPLVQENIRLYQYNGDLVGLASAFSGGLCILFIVGTCWLWKRKGLQAFLGLGFPKPKVFLKWTVIFALILAGIEVLAQFVPAFETDFMRQVLGSTTNWTMLVIGVVILGPVFEEFLLRGLMYGSLRHLADEHVSIALTAGIFAVMHLQYSVPIMLLILPMGVALGYARARSGSIWVPVLLHVANNAMSVIWP